jgi:hypothetical protein
MVQPAYECAFENAWIKSLGLNIHAPIFSHQLTKMPHELHCKLEGLLGGHAFAHTLPSSASMPEPFAAPLDHHSSVGV